MPYPIILGGDHAEFEAKHVNTPPHERPDWPMPSFDARDWAAAFCKRWPGIDEDVMVTWFANALMRGYDEHTARSATETPKEVMQDSRRSDRPEPHNAIIETLLHFADYGWSNADSDRIRALFRRAAAELDRRLRAAPVTEDMVERAARAYLDYEETPNEVLDVWSRVHNAMRAALAAALAPGGNATGGTQI